MVQKAIFYNREGEPIGPLPIAGDWAAKYEARGFTRTPPEGGAVKERLLAVEELPMKELRELGKSLGVRTVGVAKDVIVANIKEAQQGE